jgi:aspartate racemase
MTGGRGLVGIVSGLGPLAGSDVLDKLLQHAARRYGAIEDVDYPDVVLLSHGIDEFDETGTTDDLFRAELLGIVDELQLHQPELVGIACNTAHLYLDEIRQHTTAQVVDLIDEVAHRAATQRGRYLLLSSSMTRRTHLYHDRLDRYGVAHVDIDDDQQRQIDAIVHLVMGRELEVAGAMIRQVVQGLDSTQFDAVIAGCTELPLALDHSWLRQELRIIDSNRVLAQALANAHYAAHPIGSHQPVLT